MLGLEGTSGDAKAGSPGGGDTGMAPGNVDKRSHTKSLVPTLSWFSVKHLHPNFIFCRISTAEKALNQFSCP